MNAPDIHIQLVKDRLLFIDTEILYLIPNTLTGIIYSFTTS